MTETDGETEEVPGGRADSIPLGRRTVQDSHRVSLPVDRLNVEEGDAIDVYFDPVEPGVAGFVVPELPVDSKGRVTIPHYRRKDKGIEVGDKLDVTVRER